MAKRCDETCSARRKHFRAVPTVTYIIAAREHVTRSKGVLAVTAADIFA